MRMRIRKWVVFLIYNFPSAAADSACSVVLHRRGIFNTRNMSTGLPSYRSCPRRLDVRFTTPDGGFPKSIKSIHSIQVMKQTRTAAIRAERFIMKQATIFLCWTCSCHGYISRCWKTSRDRNFTLG